MQLANLSQPACEVVFLGWVVTELNFSPYLSPVERLTCPVLWCGINFDNDEALLCHLKDCPHLPTSGYWCNRCRRAESFASHKRPVPGPRDQIPVQKRHCRLKRLLQKHFIRKRAPVRSQEPTMNTNPHPQEFYGHPRSPIGLDNEVTSRYRDPLTWEGYLDLGEFNSPPSYPPSEMDGQGSGRYYGRSGLSSEREAAAGTGGQQNNTWVSHNMDTRDSPPIEMSSTDYRPEKDSNVIYELPTGDPSPPEHYQGNVPLDQSGLVRDITPPASDELLQQFENLYPSEPKHNVETTFPKFNPQSKIDGRIPAPGMGYHQGTPSVDFPGSWTTYASYDTSHTVDWAIFQRPLYQDGPNHASGLATPDYSSAQSIHIDVTPVTDCRDAGSSTRFPTHSSRNSSLSQNLAGVQNPCHPQVSPYHAPRSTPSRYGLLDAQNLAHNNSKPKIITTNVPASVGRVQQGHPNPETGPGNSPLSASSTQTNTTHSNESIVTVLTPATSFCNSDSPTSRPRRNVSNSAQSSGNSRQNQFTCKTCPTTFSDASNLRRHEKSQHREGVTIFCRARCGSVFTRRDNEKRHYEKWSQREESGSDSKRGVHSAFARKNNP